MRLVEVGKPILNVLGSFQTFCSQTRREAETELILITLMQHEPLPHAPVPCLPLQDGMHSGPVSHHRLFPLSSFVRYFATSTRKVTDVGRNSVPRLSRWQVLVGNAWDVMSKIASPSKHLYP